MQNVSLLSKKAGRILEWRYILMNFEQAIAVRDEIGRFGDRRVDEPR